MHRGRPRPHRCHAPLLGPRTLRNLRRQGGLPPQLSKRLAPVYRRSEITMGPTHRRSRRRPQVMVGTTPCDSAKSAQRRWRHLCDRHGRSQNCDRLPQWHCERMGRWRARFSFHHRSSPCRNSRCRTRRRLEQLAVSLLSLLSLATRPIQRVRLQLLQVTL